MNNTLQTGFLRDKIGVALGSFGYNLGSAVLITYLTFFLTDNMLISASSASLILLLSRIIDAFTDIWIGSCIDKTTSKMGKARPWLFWMAAPGVISVGLLFTVPNFNETGRIIYAFITYNLVAFFYLTALALPAYALVALITTDNKRRMGLSQIWGFFLTLGAVAVNYISTPLMAFFGGGNAGYFWFFTIMAVIGCLLMMIFSALVKERVKDEIDESRVKKVPFKDGVKAIAGNKYWWLVLAIQLVSSIIPSCLGQLPITVSIGCAALLM
jgi:GPH family glycoside/pentoside/hexuronide:cation symporter